MLTLGIDPGLSGAIAILDGTKLVDVFDMPVVEIQHGKKKRRKISPEMIVSELSDYNGRISAAYVEDVHAMPGQGVTSVFSFGEASGIARGVLAGLLIRTTLVSPVEWKRKLKLGRDKGESRGLAAQLWPCQAGTFKRVRDDGRAEAALIAYWGVKFGI